MYIAMLERSTRLLPTSVMAWQSLAGALTAAGRAGYRWLRPWALRSPRDLEARLTAASLALRLERPGEAEEMLAAAYAEARSTRCEIGTGPDKVRGPARGPADGTSGALTPWYDEDLY